jgi:hypothetical protein
MTMFDQNEGKMETQLAAWGTKLDGLVAAAQKQGAEAKAEYRAQLDDLKAKHQAARTRFDEFKKSGSEDLETFKTGIGNAWAELEIAFKKLTV